MKNPVLTGTRRPMTELALILAVHLVAFVAVYIATVRTVTGRELADASLRGAISARPLLSDTVQTILNVVSFASLLGAVAVVAVIALLRLARLEGLVAVGILVGSNVSTWLLKNVLLSRPDVGLDEIAPATLNSLPSGHTTAAFSAAAALVFVMPRPVRPVVATIGAGLGALTGLASMLAGWHRAADAVAAFLVVGAWTAVAAAVVVVRSPQTSTTTGVPPSGSLLVKRLGRIAVGVLVLTGVLALGLVAASLAPDSALGSASALFAGSLFIAGSAAAVTVGILRTLDVMESATGSTTAGSQS